MPDILVADFSCYQSRFLGPEAEFYNPAAWVVEIDWAAVKASGIAGVILRVGDGPHKDPCFDRYLAGVKAIGLPWGIYHAFWPGVSPIAQAQSVAAWCPEPPLGVWGDFELAGTTYANVIKYLAVLDAAYPRRAGVYSNGPDLAAYFDAAEQAALSARKLWVAGYPDFIAPEGWSKGADYTLHQYTDAYQMPGLSKPCDMSRLGPALTMDDLLGVKPMAYPVIRTGSKIGLHSITHNQLLPLVRRLAAAGITLPVALSLNDAGPFAEIKRLSPGTITICRIINPNGRWENISDPQFWDDGTRTSCAVDSVNLVFANADPVKLATTDYWIVHNEISRVAVASTVLALIPLCNEATRRGIKLAIAAWSQGEPEWADMQAMADPQLTVAMLEGGHILSHHEGPQGRLGVRQGYGDIIPGAPHVAGAGSYFFRYRYQLAAFREKGLTSPPIVLGEAYMGGPEYTGPVPDVLKRFQWVDAGVREDPEVLGVCGFTIDPDAQWLQEDYTPAMASDDALNYYVAEQHKLNGDDDMPQPLYHARALQDLALRNPDGTPATAPIAAPPAQPGLAGVVKKDTLVHVYAENVSAGAYTNRAAITPDGLSVWGVATALQKV